MGQANGEANNKRFVVEGTQVDFVIHREGQVSFYYKGRWFCAGFVGLAAKRLLVDGVEPEGSVFNGTHQTGAVK